MEKFKLGKDFLILSVLTLLTVLVWIGFEVHRALTIREIPRILKEQTTPLNPKLPQITVIDELEKKIFFTNDELKEASEATLSNSQKDLDEEIDQEIENQPATESGEITTQSGLIN